MVVMLSAVDLAWFTSRPEILANDVRMNHKAGVKCRRSVMCRGKHHSQKGLACVCGQLCQGQGPVGLGASIGLRAPWLK